MRARTLRPPLPSRPSWWLEEARVHGGADVSPPLDGPIDVDVAVVGGGFTGLWTALVLRERDPSLSVALLEAREIGDGPSGRNGGFLHGYWSSLPTLRRVLGDGAALQLAHASARIVPAVRAFCESRGEDVWFREGGMLEVSAGESEDAGVEHAFEAVPALGVGGGGDAARHRRGATPVRLAALPQRRHLPRRRDGAAGTARARAPAGGDRERSPGVRAHAGDDVRAARDACSRRPPASSGPREVVLALNVWGTSWPLGGRQTNFGSAVVLTEPVPELLEEIGWTGGEAIIDGRMFLHYFRTTPDGRVLMGSGSGRLGLGDHVGAAILDDLPAQARAERGLRDLLPGLAAAPIAPAGAGRSTSQPTSSRASARCRGRGPLRRGLLRQRRRAELARRADPRLAGARRRDEWTALPLVERHARRLPPEPFRYVGGKLVRWGTLASEEAVAAGRRPPPAARAAAAIPRLLRMPIGTR